MKTRIVKVISICLAISVVTVLALSYGLLNAWQEKVFDKFFLKKNISDEIVILAVDNESISQIGQWPWSRSIFANAVSKLQRAKVIGIDINFSESSKSDPSGDFVFASVLSNSEPEVILPIQWEPATKETVKALPIFSKDILQGLVNISVDEDGTVRRIYNRENDFLSFGYLAVLHYKGDVALPDSMRIDYAGPAKTFLTFPLSDLLNDKIPARVIENKIILIGSTAPDLHDFFYTPFGLLPGVEIHANIVNTILAQKFYSDMPIGFSALFFLVFNLVGGWLILKVKRFSWLVFSLVLVLASINILGGLLFSWKVIFPILYADISFALISLISIIFQYTAESKEKKFINESFKHYLAPDVVNELISDPQKLKLGGERKKVTILFSDIRGFTSMSEKMTPVELTHLLNEYLTEMTDIIMDDKGLVDKYIGDAVMAFWGAPLPNPGQAYDACSSAVKMIRALDKLNEHWQSKNIADRLRIGIGINTGEVAVGNMGSQKRFNYTVIGDEVNLTSRLEGLNKAYGTEILITESTKKEIEAHLDLKVRELDLITVKGKKEPKLIYELMTKPLDPDILDHFKEGRKFYKEGKWTEAIEQFSFIAGKDGPSKLYLERCVALRDNPPSEWNGVYEFKTK